MASEPKAASDVANIDLFEDEDEFEEFDINEANQYMHKGKKKTTAETKTLTKEVAYCSISASKEFVVHLICGLGLAFGFWVAHNVYSINLVSNPIPTLRLIWVIESPIVILLYSCFRLNTGKYSYWRAVGRGMLAIPAGAIVNGLGATALGAPVGIQHLPKTMHWSLMMSLFTFVPAASVCGSSWTNWHRIFACTKPNSSLDIMICLPAHGAVIGAWFGAWPMPLDWERPWQEWPTCVSYGAIVGYVVAMLASFSFSLARGGQKHIKGD